MAQLQDAVDAPREQLAPLQTPLNPNGPAPSIAGAIGDDTQKLVAAVGDAYIQHKNDQRAADVAAGQTVNIGIAQGKYADPKTGFTTTQGKAAAAAYPAFIQDLSNTLNAQVNAEKDPQVRLALQQHAATLKNQYTLMAREHVFREQQAFDNSAFQERQQAGLDQAANAWANPELRQSAISQTLGFVSAEALRKGDPDDTVGRAIDFQKKAVTGVLQRIISLPDDQYPDKGKLAEQFLDAPLIGKGPTAREVLGQDGSNLMGQVAAVNLATRAETQAQSYFAKGPPPAPSDKGNDLELPETRSVYRADGSGRIDRDALRNLIDSDIPAGAFRDQTLSRAFRMATEINEGWKDKAQPLAAQVYAQATDKNGRVDLTQADAAYVEKLHQMWPEHWDLMNKQTLATQRLYRNARDEAKDRAAAEAARDSYNDGWAALQDADGRYEQTMRMTPEQFTGQYAGTMPGNKFKQLFAGFQAAKARVDDPRPAHEDVVRLGREAFGIADARQLAELSPQEIQPLVDLETAVTRRLAQARIDAGPKGQVSPERQRQIIAEELVQVKQPGTGIIFDDTKYQYQLDNEVAARSASSTTTASRAQTKAPAVDPQIAKYRAALRPGFRLVKRAGGKYAGYGPNEPLQAGDVEVQ